MKNSPTAFTAFEGGVFISISLTELALMYVIQKSFSEISVFGVAVLSVSFAAFLIAVGLFSRYIKNKRK